MKKSTYGDSKNFKISVANEKDASRLGSYKTIFKMMDDAVSEESKVKSDLAHRLGFDHY